MSASLSVMEKAVRGVAPDGRHVQGVLEPVFIAENAARARDFFAGQGKFSQAYWYVWQENLTQSGEKRPARAAFEVVNTGSYLLFLVKQVTIAVTMAAKLIPAMM